ncbi:hypothetical protein PR202_gb02650 [Eleusine coracana subsp. coracana]|uniref:Uncharacterized protein n=1 Tax=Eleusine coracana subsp. coracana TaxID=191504 RepID=A0AAV5DZM9_ELECO|nr:hypothetical protein PR202_gb02650 [Eleusine coracana subsp. coracana]
MLLQAAMAAPATSSSLAPPPPAPLRVVMAPAASCSSSSRCGARSSVPSHGAHRRHLLKLAAVSVSDPGGSLGEAKRRRSGRREAAWVAAAACEQRRPWQNGLRATVACGIERQGRDLVSLCFTGRGLRSRTGGENSGAQRFGLSRGGERIWVTTHSFVIFGSWGEKFGL